MICDNCALREACRRHEIPEPMITHEEGGIECDSWEHIQSDAETTTFNRA